MHDLHGPGDVLAVQVRQLQLRNFLQLFNGDAADDVCACFARAFLCIYGLVKQCSCERCLELDLEALVAHHMDDARAGLADLVCSQSIVLLHEHGDVQAESPNGRAHWWGWRGFPASNLGQLHLRYLCHGTDGGGTPGPLLPSNRNSQCQSGASDNQSKASCPTAFIPKAGASSQCRCRRRWRRCGGQKGPLPKGAEGRRSRENGYPRHCRGEALALSRRG
mmetsp:Transcript_42770/g.99838  ORF Transcript_42770/g.99838 Transcript_42770/m.99838 type:complete len:221 (-) Transcript_42770:6-668(-)